MRKTVFMIAMIHLACARMQDEPASDGVAVRARTEARPCRSDSFFVDVPVRLDPSWTHTHFLGAFNQAIEDEANVPGYPWFCGDGEITCPQAPVDALTTSLLPARAEPFRSDGHLRFFRVRFSDSRGYTLSVRPDAHCSVVAAIRNRFTTHSGARPGTFFVGRECDANVSGVEGEPSEEMLTWHLTRIGLPTSSATVTEPKPSAQIVDLALVDSGVIREVGTDPGGIGLASNIDLLPTAPGYHAHGTGMAILVRQVAPEAALHSLRSLAPGGSGTGESIAAALDQAIFVASNPNQPLVINQSFGWPPELARSSRITGASCASHEDPFGEPVRYLLDVARRLDESRARRIFVVASAGNRPLPVPPRLFPPEAGFTFNPCSGTTSAGPDWFFPAEWDRVDSCRSGAALLTRVVFGVSVVDDRELPASNAIPEGEAPLVAPGQHVYAAHPNALAPAPPTGPECGSTVAFPPAVTLPRSFSGSSVGAALVSAAAARTQAARLRGGQGPFDAMTLARFLYLTARDLCRPTPAGVPVRRLDVGRLDHALATPECAALATCAESVVASDWIPSGLVEFCKYELHMCGLEDLDPWGALLPSCAAAQASVSWPATYASNACTNESGLSQFEDAATCIGTCPFADGSTQELIGSLGPQPGSPTCPDCQVNVYATSTTFDLFAELSDDFPPGTTFSEPYLVFKGLDINTQTVVIAYLDLLQISAQESWEPGASLVVSGSLDGLPNFDWTKTRASLSLLVEQPGKTPVKNVSPLRLKI